MASQDESPAEISVSDARLLAQALRDIASLKQAMGTTRGVTANDGRAELPTARAEITIVSSVAVSGKPNLWRYTAKIVAHPFVYLLSSEPPALAENVVAYNRLEVANTNTSIWGNTIATSGATCGDIIEVLPINESYVDYPVEASLYWTWFESGSPTNGYWAWWFTLPNMVETQGDGA